MKATALGGLTLACLVAGAAMTFSEQPTPQANPAGASAGTVRAHADISGDGISGTLDAVELGTGTAREVEVTLKVTGLKPGLHGMHFHAVGKCELPAFTTAGGHFDPGPFGNADPDANHPFHMGDLPNLRAGSDGTATLKARTTRVTLSDGPLSVFDADGTALIVHANPDQGITGETKSGVSGGPRIACGVLVRR